MCATIALCCLSCSPLKLRIRPIATIFIACALLVGLAWNAAPATAQTAGEGSIQGTVVDASGAVIPNATITITDNATGVKTVQNSSSAGFFNIAPVLPATYTMAVAARGFKTLVQDNVVVDALQVRVINPVLAIGTATQTVTVSAAPPVLDTGDATIQQTIENATYSALPILMNNSQRDPTAFAMLTPGTESANGGRLPIVNGTGSYLGQLYLDGMPAETVSQQGDNRLVSEAVDLDAVNQMQVLTSTPSAEYMGAGAENYTMKSGGLQYHGSASDFVRNTFFDTWGFSAPHSTTKNLAGQTVQAPKPAEHQNEMSLDFGGRVPHTGKKMFFFVAYDKYHESLGPSYSLYTIPSTLMTQGNFTELNGGVGSGLTGTGSNNPPIIYDPTTTTCSGSTCTRQPFEYNGTYNVIPPGDISPIAKNMEQFIPSISSKDPNYGNYNSSAIYNNYLGGLPKGYNNHVINWRVDYNLSAKHRLSSIGAMGAVNYLNNYGSPFLPLPYTGGDLANIFPKTYIVEDDYTLTPNLVNQFKYGFTRFFQNIHNSTQGVKAWEGKTMGITNLPGGQAGEEFPGEAFGTTSHFSSGEQGWTGNSGSYATQVTTPNNYGFTDNLMWLKGRHAFTFGATFQWQEINNANPATLTGVLDLSYNAFSTANFGPASNLLNPNGTLAPGSAPSGKNIAATGFSYGSFLLGAVGGSTGNATSAPGLGLDYVSELAGRYKTFSPYFQDSYKVARNLTLNLGLRWDYLPPYHELRNRWTFLNPTLTNPLTGTPGMLQFAGNYGGAGVSCGCTTPVHTFWGNWGPRVGMAWSMDSKTVLRTGFAMVFTQAGGVGGRGGAYNGTGQTGFNTTIFGPTENDLGTSAGPSYWLNTNTAYLGGAANSSLFGPGATYPGAPSPSVTAQEINTGYYLNSTGGVASAGGVQYADPHYSGRAPELEMFNYGIERELTPSLTIAANYVGNLSHFIVNSGTTGSNARGYWANELNPYYLAILGPVTGDNGAPLLDAPADSANVATLLKYVPNAPAPAFYTAAGNVKNSSATIAHMLVHFPQYSGLTDAWGNVSNFNYNSLQITLEERTSHGLTFDLNYTYAKNVGDDGTFRSGFDLPAGSVSRTSQAFKMDRIDRGWTADSTPESLHFFGRYDLPFGRGHIGDNSMLVRALAGGWTFSWIYQYHAGTPVAVTWSGTSGSTYVGQGTAMPDLNPAFTGSTARMNGSYGKGPNGYQYASLGHVQYVNVNAFTTPQNVSSSSTAQYLIGNAPRTKPMNLRNPGTQDLDAGLRRSFPLHFENTQFVFEANCTNVWNKVTFGGPSGTWGAGSTTFGTVGSAGGTRDWQFAGHINF